uniref:Myb-like domain-containing protein n=1 Tax=Panagrolaimus sp. JU765 TaxID=591449 RepID=A0AC34Q6D3_9BILA
MEFERWEPENDELKAELRCQLRNVDVYALLMFNDMEYQKFLQEDTWTMEETRYLMQMYRKYNVLWSVIADRYDFRGKRRSTFDVERRFHFVYDSMCLLREKEEMMTNYDPEARLFNLNYLRRYFNRTANERIDEARILEEISKLSDETDADEDEQVKVSTLDVNENGKSPSKNVETRQSSQRSFCGILPSAIKSDKLIEQCLNVAEYCRFYNKDLNGCHCRSDEITISSNVSFNKRTNIDNLSDKLKLTDRVCFTTEAIKDYHRLAKQAFVITELKNVLDAAVGRLDIIYHEYCEITGKNDRLVLSEMPKPMNGTQTIWDKVDPSIGHVSLNMKFDKLGDTNDF